MKVLVGCERSGRVRDAFRRRGHDAFSCDLMPAPGKHIQCDVRLILDAGWDLAIFHPPCTYLTSAAEWAYGNGPYHQEVTPGTLTGWARREARVQAVIFVFVLRNAPIHKICIENPRGYLSRIWRKPNQIIQPYQFGDNAAKATHLWLKNLLPLFPTHFVEGRRVNDLPRWSNQSDSGQNREPDDSTRDRAVTYDGIAKAMAEQWG
jgi:hypothetical protein